MRAITISTLLAIFTGSLGSGMTRCLSNAVINGLNLCLVEVRYPLGLSVDVISRFSLIIIFGNNYYQYYFRFSFLAVFVENPEQQTQICAGIVTIVTVITILQVFFQINSKISIRSITQHGN